MSRTPLFTLAEIETALGGPVHLEIPVDLRGDFTGVSIDSRTVSAGDLFVAIRGESHDGHDFAAAAIAAGARAALVSADKAPQLQALGLPLIIVPDAFRGLADLGRFARARMGGKVVAITGSVGKTSTRELIRQVLQTKGKTHASERSFNNHWGVPLTLARMPADTDFAVIEMGMNHAGEIAPLARLTRPHVAVITHVSEAHLAFFDSVAGIAAAKAEIFEGLEPGGVAIIGADHGHVGFLAKTAVESGASRVVSYGLAASAEVRVDAATGVVTLAGETISLNLKQLGAHAMVNAAGALAVGEVLGVDPAVGAAALAGAKAEPGRGVIHHLSNGITLIDDSYNANPASMRAALAMLGEWRDAGRRMAVLGDMLELGSAAEKLHTALKDPIAESGAKKVFLVGIEMRALAAAMPESVLAGHFANVAEATEAVVKSLASGDVVMVKGSNGIGLAGLVRAVIERFGEERASES